MKYLAFLCCFVCLYPIEAQVVKKAVPVAQGKFRTAQQDAELKQWIIGIQDLARVAQDNADKAETEAVASRGALTKATEELTGANLQADKLQTQINLQTANLNQAIDDKNKAVALEQAVIKKNKFLETILAVEAAALAVFILLWLGVPNMAAPWGLVATVASPVVVFGLTKLIL